MTWFLKSIGVEGEMLEHLDQAELAFQRPALLWLGSLLLLPAAYFICRRQRDLDVPRRLRWALNVGRVLVLLIIVVILSGPYLRLDLTIAKKPLFAVLLDTSESMQLPSHRGDSLRAGSDERPRGTGDPAAETRMQLARRAIADGQVPLDSLGRDYDLRFYYFARELTATTMEDAKVESKSGKPGAGSFIGDAVKQVVDEAGGNKIAGLLVFSDGQSTGGRSLAEAARAASDSHAAVFTVPLGSSEPLGDVAIVDVETSSLVTVEDTVRVNVAIESTNLDGEQVWVELKEDSRLLDREQLVLQSGQPQQVELTFKAEHEGARYLDLSIPPLREEVPILRTNNVDTAFVRVTDEKLRVLLLDGHPRWDFRFLKNALRRDDALAGRDDDDPDIIAETEWRRWPTERQEALLPQTLEEISEYHAIVLGDVSPELLGDSFQHLLMRAVREEGVGLIVQAGTEAMPHRYGAEFQKLLPVRLRRGRAGLVASEDDPFRIELAADAAQHDAMRLSDNAARNRELWAGLPDVFWCAAAEQPSPAASVLAWNPSVRTRGSKQPLIAWHQAGDGKVMFVGTDATWRWRLNVGDQIFYRFWGQSLRFVARQNDLGKKSWIAVSPTRLERGAKTAIELHAFDDAGSPVDAATQRITVIGPEATQSLELTRQGDTPGVYTGTLIAGEVGTHRLLYEPPGDGEPARATVQARVAPDEYRRPSVDRSTLQLLATSSGGEMLELEQLRSIPEKLHVEREVEQIHRETTIWDNWLMLMIMLSIYGTDIGMRRMTGLS